MYPEVSKEHLPSAPPSYSESVNTPNYSAASPPYPTSNVPQHQMPYPNASKPSLYNPNMPGHSQPMAGAYQQPAQVIVVQQNAIPPLGPQPVQLNCPTCKAVVVTSIRDEPSNSAYICCMMMCLFGLWCCSCVPFCMDNFKNVKHTCPKCNAFIGEYHS